MTSAAGRAPTGPDPFRHLAVVHHGVDELMDTLVPLLDAAAARGDLVWAVVGDTTREVIERRLGAAAAGVAFGEPSSYSAQTTASRRADRLRDVIADGGTALILSDATGTDWSVVDASCNLTLSGMPVTLICLYDAESPSEDTERFLYWNHAELVVDTTTRRNPRHRTPAEVFASTTVSPAPALGPPTDEQRFANATALRGIRVRARQHSMEAGLDPARVDGLLVAVCELVSNSIEHGPGHGTLSWWISPGRVTAQIDDEGHMTPTTPGLRRPDTLSVRGRGVWLARRLCDVVHLWTDADGTHARLEIGS